MCAIVTSVAVTAAYPVFAQSTAATGSPAAMASMRRIGDAARRIKSATLDIINDVEQTKLAATPNDPLILDPPDNNRKDDIVWGKQMQQMGPLEQPKKDWIDTDMSHLERAVQLLNSEFSGTAFGDKQQATSDTWNQMNAVLADINTHFADLQKLTAGPTYDNLAIGKAALRIHDDLKKLVKPWKATVITVKK